MEIPYIVTPRKDTGLFNSKIAIWLFLASEVMLFGGLFSAYVFLRIGADYPWPERTLPVLPGLINTFVLIGSSVTVVFAWASLKMRRWGWFKFYMTVTVACAALFMCLKALEYSVKLHHQAVRLNDYSIIEGHLGKELGKDGKPILNLKGDEVEENIIKVETTGLTFNTLRYHKEWVEELIDQAKHHGSKIVLPAELKAVTEEGKPSVTLGKEGEELTLDLLAKLQKMHLTARTHNQKLSADSLRAAWEVAHAANPGKRDWMIKESVKVDAEGIKPKLLTEIGTVKFKVDPAVDFDFVPRDIKEADGSSLLRDDTVVEGKLHESPMGFHHVDAIDFQYLAMKSVEKGIDPMKAIEGSWVMQNFPFARQAWKWHQEEIAKLEKQLIDDYGKDAKGKPNREPTAKERYRLGWKDLAKKAEDEGRAPLGFVAKISEEFKGPNYDARGDETFPEFEIPREQVAFASKFAPAWNTYYAIYFTITGLHGLHVIGGALVLLYYLLFTRKMYETDPEWLANRVEIGGLFWHFVDLVWIFAFPIFYLM
jgi:heme/copper-type cytochrome/quinol oxidase subunit 3